MKAGIEVFKHAANTDHPTRLPPILLIPGAYSGAEYYDNNWIPMLNDYGFDCYSMSFRGRNSSRLQQFTITLDDYQADLAEAISLLPEPPILIAHSLGGYVAGRYCQQHQLPACILISPVPPDGVLSCYLSMCLRVPWSAFKMLSIMVLPQLANFGSPPHGLYSPNVPQPEIHNRKRMLGAEPLLAMLQLATPPPFQYTGKTKNILILGAQDDLVIPAHDVKRAIKQLQADGWVYPHMGHCMMIEPEAKTICEEMLTWLIHKRQINPSDLHKQPTIKVQTIHNKLNPNQPTQPIALGSASARYIKG